MTPDRRSASRCSPRMLVLMALRVPIAAAMFIPGALGYVVLANDTALLNQLKGSSVARLTVYDLSVIPLFLLMGQFATQGGLSRALFEAAAAFVGHIRGGLGDGGGPGAGRLRRGLRLVGRDLGDDHAGGLSAR